MSGQIWAHVGSNVRSTPGWGLWFTIMRFILPNVEQSGFHHHISSHEGLHDVRHYLQINSSAFRFWNVLLKHVNHSWLRNFFSWLELHLVRRIQVGWKQSMLVSWVCQ